MPESFEDLGLRAELVRAAADAGFSVPTPLQRATIPLLRRGGNAIIRASSGAGVTAAWGLPLLDRLEGTADGEGDERALRLLAVLPTEQEAARVAHELAPFAQAAGLRLVAVAPGWANAHAGADIVLATARDALRAVESSALKSDALAALVVVGAGAVLELEGTDALDTLTGSIPRDAQRVLTSGELTPEVESLAERHVRKAMHIPSRPAEEPPPPPATGQLDYAVVQAEEKLDRAATTIEPGTVFFCRSDARAAELAAALTLRGFHLGAADDADADAAVASTAAAPGEVGARRPVSYDVPFDAALLAARHAERGGLVLVLARELPHLRRIAREAGLALRPIAEPRAAGAADLENFRRRLRAAALEEDLDAQLLVLEPLLRERSAAELAAAASALLRRRPPAEPGAAPAGGAPRETAAGPGFPARTPRGAVATGAPPASYTRLFVSMGQRDGMRPGDLVSVIAGETAIPGERIGRIEVRDSFSIVEVPTDLAERVIRAVNGITVKGRSVRVDYDRRKSPPPRRQEGGRTRRE